MIAEPYICIKGKDAGLITWLQPDPDLSDKWFPYADFEREKLRVMRPLSFCVDRVHGYFLRTELCRLPYASKTTIGYDGDSYVDDSESNRLLKRAEFLKAVCEKEGVEWLPTESRGEYVKTGEALEAHGTIHGKPFSIRIEAGMPDDEVRFRDERSGDEVTLKNVGIEKTEHEHEWSECAWREDVGIVNRCYGCDGRRPIEPEDVECDTCRRQFAKGQSEEPDRDYYTRAEVDELLKERQAIFDAEVKCRIEMGRKLNSLIELSEERGRALRDLERRTPGSTRS